ncbi:unnamed protein product, partial [Sphacelaria rigidula]
MASEDATKRVAGPAPITEKDITRNVGLIVRAVETSVARLTTRAISRNTPIRRGVQADVLCETLTHLVSEDAPHRAKLLVLLAKLPSEGKQSVTSTQVYIDPAAKNEKVAAKPPLPAGGAAGELPTAEAILAAGLPEVEIYLSTLALTTLLRHGATADAVGIAPALLERAVSFNRRTWDSLAAKMLFYYPLVRESGTTSRGQTAHPCSPPDVLPQ